MVSLIDSDSDKVISIKLNENGSTDQKLNYNKISNNENNIDDYINNKIEISNKGIDNIIRILTYNFFCRPPPIKTNESDYKDARIADFIEKIDNFDIICFQELFTTLNDRKHKMIREGSKRGLKYYTAPKVPSFFSKYLVDSGLLIISRYPIVDNDFYEYYINISGDSPTEKGVLYAKIEIKKDVYLFLFNTHLQSTYYEDTPENMDSTIQVRTKQTEELINFIYNKLLTIPKNEIKNGKIILLGDFNIDAHDNIYAQDRYKLPKYKYTEYDIFYKKINKLGQAIDLMKKKFNKHLFTFGDNDIEQEHDQVLTGKGSYNVKQTLDYIWEIIPDYNLDIYNIINEEEYDNENNNGEGNNSKNNIEVLYNTLNVQKFLIKDRPYQQLSDHFALSVQLKYL
jgi:sphingomyelin phosphodiesterase